MLTVGRPSTLPVPNLNSVDRASEFLNMSEGLLKIGQIGRCSIADLLALPVCKCVHQATGRVKIRVTSRHDSNILQELNTTLDERVSSTIRIFIPAICRPDFYCGEHFLDRLNTRKELLSSQALAVEGFRSNSDGINMRERF